MRSTLAIAQCYANVHAALAHYGIPEPAVLGKLADRVIYAALPEAIERIEWLTQVWSLFAKWDFVSNHGVTAIRGWREAVATCSMQIVQHTHALEVDFDRFNPDYGVLPALGHLCEVIRPGKTDPAAIARGLRKRGIEVPEITEEQS